MEVPTLVVPTRRDWARLLSELVSQLDDGRIYDRDLADLRVQLAQVLEAHNRRANLLLRPSAWPR